MNILLTNSIKLHMCSILSIAVLTICVVNISAYFLFDTNVILFGLFLIPLLLVSTYCMYNELENPKIYTIAIIYSGVIALLVTMLFSSTGYVYAIVLSLILYLVLALRINNAVYSLTLNMSIHTAVFIAYLHSKPYINSIVGPHADLVLSLAGVAMIVILYFNSLFHISTAKVLEQCLGVTGTGVVTLDKLTNKLSIDHTAAQIIGYHGDITNFSPLEFSAMVHDDDKAAFNNAITTGEHASMTIRIKTPDNGCVYVKGKRFHISDRYSISLLTDVTVYELDKLEREKTVKELRNKSYEQSRLYSVVAHELRTPAASLFMLLSEYFGQHKDRLTEEALNISKHLIEVLDDMRIVMEPTVIMESKKTNTSIFSLIYSSKATLHAFNSDNIIDIVYDSDALSTHTFNINARLIKQVSLNLIKNAIVHSNCKKIKVYVSGIPNSTIDNEYKFKVDILDNGDGITPHVASQMFDPFYQGNRDAPGSGLGLYICKQIANKLCGDIVYTPQRRGSLFSFTFTATSVDDSSTSRLPVDYNLAGCRILFVEDDKTLTALTVRILEKFNATVVHAADGQDALAIYDRELGYFDLVLTDYHMPKMNGDELTKILRRKGYTRPIVALTAATIGKETDHLIQAGATAVLSKPIQIEDLVEFIE